MILDETSSLSTRTAAQDEHATNCEANAASIVVTTNSDTKKIESKTAVTASSCAAQTLNAINSNTYVVKLEPPPENGAINRTPKTNLLQLFSENGNLSVVKALGIGRIVVNRTLLKNAKNKQTATTLKQPRVSSQEKFTSIGISRTPIFIRTAQQTSLLSEKENKKLQNYKKDDDISGNLANFMNFKLTGLVHPSMKTDPGINTFKIHMKPPELRLPSSKQNTVSLSSSKSMFEEMKSESSDEPIDDDLTSLSWLTSIDKALLKTIRSCNPDDAGISLSGDDTDEEHDYNVVLNKTNAVFTANAKVECGSQGGFATRQYGQPYSPNGKPPYSFSCLIFMAVEDSQDKMLPVKQIYSWVCRHFPYFETAPSGWKNSIRHNLSLNKCFKKVDQGRHSHDPGKGSLWCIDPAYRPNLIQALKRTPYYPYLYPSGISQPLSLTNLASLLPGVKSGRIPLWSPSLTQPNSYWADPDVASAALNLMGLRGNDATDSHPPNVRSTIKELAAEIFKQNDDVTGTIPLVISDPADDHTYSTMSFVKSKNEITVGRCLSPDSDKSAPDAAYEFEAPGTDLESDVEIDDPTDSDGDLGDSGFAGLRTKKGSWKNKGRKTRKLSGPAASKSKRSKSSTTNSSKSTQVHSKKALKVRFQQKKKSKVASPTTRTRILKRKFSPQEPDDVLTSDADSGKDSPKVQTKSRRRTSLKIVPPPAKKVKKTTFFKPTTHTSPYGTRSSKQTRSSRRIGALEHGNVLERASARKRRQDYVTADTDDEEIKLAADSLLHLAGFRSPP